MSAGQHHRFFVDHLPDAGGGVEPTADVARHVRVLRLEVGAEITLFDGSGQESRARIDGLDPLRCTAAPPSTARPDRPEVHLIQALPKGKKLDSIVRMSTELGVDGIHLAISERAISRPDASKSGGKIARLTKVAREASRQARRRTIPEIHPPAALAAVAERADADALRLVFWEEAEEYLPDPLGSETAAVWVVVGPEGGLSHTEVSSLQESGWTPVRLFSTIMRVETAAPTALALVLDRVGRFRR